MGSNLDEDCVCICMCVCMLREFVILSRGAHSSYCLGPHNATKRGKRATVVTSVNFCATELGGGWGKKARWRVYRK